MMFEKRASDFSISKRDAKILVILLVGFLILSVTMISGCVEQEKLKSPEEAQKAIVDVSNDVEGASGILEDIDKKLG